MSGRVIAIANSKGGVGKTTTTVSLAEACAASGHKTLIMDLDFQSNASLLVFGNEGDDLLYDAIRGQKTVSDYLKQNFLGGDGKHLEHFIVKGASDVQHKGETLQIDLVPATPGLREVERELIYTFTERGFDLGAIEQLVREVLQPDLDQMRDVYDVVIADCPPGISAMTEAFLLNADLIVVPTIPDFMSTMGVDVFCGEITRKLSQHGEDELVPWILPTKFEGTPKQTRVLDAMRENAAIELSEYKIFETVIPNRTEFAVDPFELGDEPTLAQKWPGEALARIDALYSEVKEQIL